MCRVWETVRTPPEGPVLERGKAIQAISRNHACKDTSTDVETRLHGEGAGYDGYGVVCMGFSAKRHYIFSATWEAERRGYGDGDGDIGGAV